MQLGKSLLWLLVHLLEVEQTSVVEATIAPATVGVVLFEGGIYVLFPAVDCPDREFYAGSRPQAVTPKELGGVEVVQTEAEFLLPIEPGEGRVQMPVASFA